MRVLVTSKTISAPSCARRWQLRQLRRDRGTVSWDAPPTFRAAYRPRPARLGLIPLELAVHKMTGATARALKLKIAACSRKTVADVAIFAAAALAHLRRSASYQTGTHTTVNASAVSVEDWTPGTLPGNYAAGGQGLTTIPAPPCQSA